jgi:TRAP-type C4-dicarboxylate transport system permease small subunit
MNALRQAVDRVLGWTICLLTAVMVINVLWQVFTRFVLHNPSSFTEEAARYMMIWVGLLGAAYASGRKAHLALDLVTAHLHGAQKRVSDLVIHSVVLLFALGAMVGGGGRLVWIQLSLGQQSAALQVKLGYIYLAVPIAGALIVFYSVLALIEVIRRPAVEAGPARGDLA